MSNINKLAAAAAILAYCAFDQVSAGVIDIEPNDGHDITCSVLKPANGDAGGVWGTSPKLSDFYPFITPPQGESCKCSIDGLPCEGLGRWEYGDNQRDFLYYYSCVKNPDTGKYTCCEDALRLVTPWGAVDCPVNPNPAKPAVNKPKAGGLLLQNTVHKTSIISSARGN